MKELIPEDVRIIRLRSPIEAIVKSEVRTTD